LIEIKKPTKTQHKNHKKSIPAHYENGYFIFLAKLPIFNPAKKLLN